MNHFSPTTVQQSPVNLGKGLTGSQRVAYDTIIGIYNATEKLNNHDSTGRKIIEDIVTLVPRDPNAVNNELHSLTSDLFHLVENCFQVLGEIGIFCERLKALIKLHKEEFVIFSFFPLDKLEMKARNVHEIYERRLKHKKTVLENIAFSECKSHAIFFARLWKYKEDDRELNESIVSLLKEIELWKT